MRYRSVKCASSGPKSWGVELEPVGEEGGGDVEAALAEEVHDDCLCDVGFGVCEGGGLGGEGALREGLPTVRTCREV